MYGTKAMFEDTPKDLEGPERRDESLENPTRLVTDGRLGTVQVGTDDDHRITTDGGRDMAPDRFALTLEYTTIDGRRQRVTFVRGGDDARRITHERRDGEWCETGRQLISDLAVRFDDRSGRFASQNTGP
ncbi:hypothetical protein AB7C87_20630 [Natrarchaeobius sp. A-rgal3]|uniref:hypothetical protein n=1 Tax=Natrarchaeobius versutus TaxID=1679078 RepID=UPI00350EC469